MLDHRYYESDAYMHFKIDEKQRPKYMEQVMEIIKIIPPESRRQFERYFLTREDVLHVNHSKPKNLEGWNASGIGEFLDVRKILSNCTSYHKNK